MYIGAPDLPATTISFLIPQDKKVKGVNFINVERIKVPGTYNIIPKQPPRLTDGSPLPPFVEPEPWYYKSYLPYPPLQYEIVNEGFRSEYRIVTLRIYPLIYIPFAESLWLSTHIQMSLELEQDVNWGVPVKRRSEISHRTIENLIKALVVNPEDVDGYGSIRIEEENPDLNKLEITDAPSLQGGCADYVIITSDVLKESFQELADWKTSKGIITIVKSESWIDEHYIGCDRQERIRNFIKDAHSNWGTDYFLLGGDTDILPIRSILYTDLYYSDLEGTWNENNNSIFGESPIYVDIVSLGFVDEHNGWCITPHDIFRTYDGGKSWEIQIGSGSDISAVDEINAWVVENSGSILHTTNGGYTWEKQTVNASISSLFGVDFTDLSNGWSAGTEGTIIHTTNGGDDWSVQLQLGENQGFYGISFSDNFNGWAVGYSGKSNSIIYHTTNGGNLWQLQRYMNNEILHCIQAISSSEAWAGGVAVPSGPARVLHTTDGGTTWVKDEFEGIGTISDIVFVNSLEGWFCTRSGYIYHTDDGGNSWNLQKQVPNTLNKIDFIDVNYGWSAGGTVCWHTTNGGADWKVYYFPQLGDTSVEEYDPDVFVGRAPVKNNQDVETFTNKVLCYEKNPPMDDDYLNRILFLAADLGPGVYDALISKEKFQNKDWYPTEFFHKYELYGPVIDIYHDPPWWHGDELISRSAVIDRMNMGYHFINHMDHSNPYAMGTYSINGEHLVRDDVDGLTNGNKTSIIWTYGCHANAFQYDGISEHLMNNPNGGAVAFIGNTHLGYTSQDEQDYQFFKSIFGDNIYHLGCAFSTTQGSGFLPSDSKSMNLLGEPEMPVWTDNPKHLLVIKPDEVQGPGTHTITITVKDISGAEPQPLEGALVCLKKDEEAYGYQFTNESGEATFSYKPESPGKILVTVTAHNFLPYEGDIRVLPTDAPYGCFDSEIIDDDNTGSSIGNGDGVVNPGETIEMPVILKNNGTAIAHSVQAILSLTGVGAFPPVTIIADSQSFGDILAGGTAQSLLPYVFNVSKDCEPGYEIHFHLRIKQGLINSWTDDFVVKVLADSLIQTRHTISFDDVNGNGIIDPDEDVYIDSLEITNYGEGGADDVEATLSTDDPRVIVTNGDCSVGDIPGISYVTIPPVTEPHCFVFYCTPEVPSVFDFTLALTDRFGREWQQKVDLTAPNPPDSVWASLFGQDFSNLTWDYFHIPKALDISGYNIYRSNNEAGPFTRVNKMPLISFSLFNDENLNTYTDYYYRISAVDTSGNESKMTVPFCVRTNPSFQYGWPREVMPLGLGGNWSAPVFGDLDGDGDLEIVALSGDSIYIWNHNGELLPNWPIKKEVMVATSPCLADLDGDGKLEIILRGGDDKKVYIWRSDGTDYSGWPKVLDKSTLGSVTVSDIDLDGDLEIIVPTAVSSTPGFTKIYAWHSNGTLVSGWPVEVEGYSNTAPAVGDLDDDGKPEIVVASADNEDGYLYAFHSEGNNVEPYFVYKFNITGDRDWLAAIASPVIGDIDGDKKPEIIGVIYKQNDNVHNSYIAVLENDGEEKWRKDSVSGYINDSPALGDINRDGKIDVVCSSGYASDTKKEGILYVWNYTGNELLKVALPAGEEFTSSISLADIDNDGKPEILCGSFKGRLYAFNNDGSYVPGFPLYSSLDLISSTPTIGDVDLDGDYEVVYTGNDQKVYIWDVLEFYNKKFAVWHTYHHDNWNTGNYDFVVPETYSTTDSLATAYNNERKVVNNGSINVVYSSLNKVFFTTSQDGNQLGQRWIIGDGSFPVLSSYTDISGRKVFGTVWVNDGTIAFSRYTEVTGWSKPWTLIAYAGPEIIHYTAPSLIIDDVGIGHLAWEMVTEPLQYPGYIGYELHYSTFDARLEKPVLIENDILDEASEYVNEWTPEYVSASLDLDGNNNPVVAWSRSIGEGKNVVYFKQKVGGIWPSEPEVVSSPTEVSHHPFCDIANGEIEVVWENEGIIKHRQRPLTGDWSPIYTVSNPENYSRSPQILDGDICIYTEFPQLQPNHYSNVVYRMRLGDGNWLPSQIIESTPYLSEYPQSYIETTAFPRILHIVWTEGNNAPYEVKYKKVILPLKFSGHISENTTWDKDIYIMGDVTVDSGVTLTIEPGVMIYFALSDCEESGIDRNRCELIIDGRLVADGTESDSIYFTSAGTEPHRNDWYGIRFLSSDTSSLDYVNLAYAKTGINYGQNSVAIVENSFISNNETGVSATQSLPTIRKCIIDNNFSGIYCSNCTNVIIDSCQITNDRSMNGMDLT